MQPRVRWTPTIIQGNRLHSSLCQETLQPNTSEDPPSSPELKSTAARKILEKACKKKSKKDPSADDTKGSATFGNPDFSPITDARFLPFLKGDHAIAEQREDVQLVLKCADDESYKSALRVLCKIHSPRLLKDMLQGTFTLSAALTIARQIKGFDDSLRIRCRTKSPIPIQPVTPERRLITSLRKSMSLMDSSMGFPVLFNGEFSEESTFQVRPRPQSVPTGASRSMLAVKLYGLASPGSFGGHLTSPEREEHCKSQELFLTGNNSEAGSRPPTRSTDVPRSRPSTQGKIVPVGGGAGWYCPPSFGRENEDADILKDNELPCSKPTGKLKVQHMYHFPCRHVFDEFSDFCRSHSCKGRSSNRVTTPRQKPHIGRARTAEDAVKKDMLSMKQLQPPFVPQAESKPHFRRKHFMPIGGFKGLPEGKPAFTRGKVSSSFSILKNEAPAKRVWRRYSLTGSYPSLLPMDYKSLTTKSPPGFKSSLVSIQGSKLRLSNGI